MIDRLVYDPQVIEEVSRYCETENVPRDVAVARVQRYARPDREEQELARFEPTADLSYPDRS